jgi:phosphatidylethanolamine/phosphatidyl-N-methylethanolamine N-methyltransferase
MIGLDATGILSKLWKYPHYVMEREFKDNSSKDILEIGVGEGEHIHFVQPNYRKYVALDIDKVRLQKISEMDVEGLEVVLGNAEKLDFEDESFDRVIATCLLVHLLEPEKALKEWHRVLRPGGSATIYVPCEPGLILKIFRNIVTKPKARKLGFNGYDLFIARDHLTSADRVITLTNHVFAASKTRIDYFPFGIRSWYLNLFLVIRITK